jgi:EAL domain-containing protein (putative c-di-GMP-specific phosphodiesterase class I)
VGGDRLCSVVGLAVDASRAARIKREFVEQFGSGTFRVGDRAGVDAALDRALASLWMAYQPIVCSHSHQLFACEALLRTSEPTLPHPGAVLQAAQRTQRLRDVGRTVRERVAADIANAAERDELCLFVNLHAEDLADPALTSPNSALSVFAPQIVLEITERVSLDTIQGVPERIAQLRALGYRIALDDLGAGYAGLSSLTQLEPEFVKLDMSLVRDAHQSAVKQRLIRAVVDLCHDMGKFIIAEGVETEAELTTLEALKCDYLQGFLFARPQRDLPRASSQLAAATG